MSTYYSDGRDSALPSIRRSGILDPHHRRGITTIDDTIGINGVHRDLDRHVRFRSTSPSHVYSETRDRSDQLFYPRPPSPSRKANLDLHEEIKLYREEISKRDRLIQQLSSFENTSARHKYSTATLESGTRIEDLYSSDRIAALADAKSQIAALNVKVNALSAQLRDSQVQVDLREEKMKELRAEVEAAREADARNNEIVASLREKLAHFETATGTLEGTAARSELAVQSLQRDAQAHQDRILELESRVRTHLEERERAEQDMKLFERKYTDLLSQVRSVLRVEDGYISDSSDHVVAKLSDVIQENAVLKGKLVTLEGTLANCESETKASRETIMRLVNEQEREQKTMNRSAVEMENARVERDNAVAVQRELEREVEHLKERLDQSQRAWGAARRELEEKEGAYIRSDQYARDTYGRASRGILRHSGDYSRDRHMTPRDLTPRGRRRSLSGDRVTPRVTPRLRSWSRDRLDDDMLQRERALAVSTVEGHFRSFKEQLAQLLSLDGHHSVEAYEEVIRSRVKDLVLSSKDRDAHSHLLESKIANLTDQLEAQRDLQRQAERRAQQAQSDFMEAETRLRRYEGELAAGDALRDGMRVDKDRYLRFLERVSHVLTMDPINLDVGFDMTTEAILARCEQLVKLEGDALNDRKTHIYNLQRKVKSMKEQLESRDLHLELMRKKVATLEERLGGKMELERDKDTETMKTRKLIKLCEKYKAELQESRFEVRDLKARLLEFSDYRGRTMEQERELENLESKVGQLEHVRAKQARKIHTLKDSLDNTSEELQHKRGAANNTIQALSSELRTTKSALDEVTKRERQLLDLRQVISRMLGLDVNTLAVPDYEIISRLEKLILANQSNTVTVGTLDSAIHDMEDGFREGYEDAARTLIRSRSPGRASRHTRTRSRSLSPNKTKRDPRQY